MEVFFSEYFFAFPATPSLFVSGVGAEATLGHCVPSALIILGSWTGNETSVTQKTFANINIAFMIAQNLNLRCMEW